MLLEYHLTPDAGAFLGPAAPGSLSGGCTSRGMTQTVATEDVAALEAKLGARHLVPNAPT